MNLSSLLQDGLLEYVREIRYEQGKICVLFGGYGENEAEMEMKLSVSMASDRGLVVAECKGTIQAELFSFENPTPAAMFYSKLRILEYNRRTYESLVDFIRFEFGCRDNVLYGWGEYNWD